MRRRDFLAAGAALTAAPALARIARATPREPSAPAHVWRLGGTRYEFRLDGAALTCHCFDAEDPGHANAPDRPEDAAIVALGPHRRPVEWSLEVWEQRDPNSLVARLVGIEVPLRAEASFLFDPASGLLQRRTVLQHTGEGEAVDIRATLGFWVRVHEPIVRMLHLSGAWGQEAQIQHGAFGDEPLNLESRAGKTGFEFQPYVALRAEETSYVCELFWSGNWILRVVPRPGGVLVLGGFNNWRFRHRLQPGTSLTYPAVLFGRIPGDLNAATQRLHDWRRAHRPDPDRPIPVQFNSWYPYAGEPSQANMLPLIPVAQRLGCEAFVVDAGWYRTEEDDSEVDWQLRTGDWRVSRSRFPNGLSEISRACREHGLVFGLWFEPETLGSLSSLRREHPEWLHWIGGVPPKPEARAVLNLGVPAAWEHVFDRVSRLLQVIGVGWMKWDFNVDIGAGGWAPDLPATLTAQDPLVAHYEGLYRLEDALRAAFPAMILEMCAGGGGRMDGEILSRAHVNWISDQPAPLQKLAIHFGSQLAHPAVVCNDWLIEWPPVAAPPPGLQIGEDPPRPVTDERGDLPFRLRVAMLGSFGFSAHVDRWPEADFETAAMHARLYATELRAVIHHGDQYFLTRSPPLAGNGDWAAIWYVSKDQAKGVLFAFRLAGRERRRVFHLAGLALDRRYRVRRISEGSSEQASGEELRAGLPITLADRYRSEICVVDAA